MLTLPFCGGSAVWADRAHFLGSNAVPGDASLVVSTFSTTFQGRNAIRVDNTDFLRSSVVAGIASLTITLLALPSQERVILGQTALAFWEAALSQERGLLPGGGPSGLGSFPSYISFLFA